MALMNCEFIDLTQRVCQINSMAQFQMYSHWRSLISSDVPPIKPN